MGPHRIFSLSRLRKGIPTMEELWEMKGSIPVSRTDMNLCY